MNLVDVVLGKAAIVVGIISVCMLMVAPIVSLVGFILFLGITLALVWRLG
jgi:hypothetical protein